MKSKDQLRVEARDVLSNIPSQQKLSESICNNILASDYYLNNKNILFFYPLSREPNILSVIKQALADKKSVFLPFAEQIAIGKANNLSELVTDKQGLKVPAAALHPLPPIDVAFIPGLLFSKDLDRLGSGGGWYDKFFSLPKDLDIKKVGVCFHEQLVNMLPAENHDIKMDFLITQKTV